MKRATHIWLLVICLGSVLIWDAVAQRKDSAMNMDCNLLLSKLKNNETFLRSHNGELLTVIQMLKSEEDFASYVTWERRALANADTQDFTKMRTGVIQDLLKGQ